MFHSRLSTCNRFIAVSTGEICIKMIFIRFHGKNCCRHFCEGRSRSKVYFNGDNSCCDNILLKISWLRRVSSLFGFALMDSMVLFVYFLK